jgi:uncharacterized protein
VRRARIDIPCGDLVLEGVLSFPTDEAGVPAVVVCHPHPLHGGSMYNSVVLEVCREVEAKGLISLRFNFRGVGNSSGTYDQGVGEQDDLRAAITFLKHEEAVAIYRIGVAGYSFGAGVATRVAASDGRVKSFVAISLPPRLTDTAALESCTKPKLFVAGGADHIVSVEVITRLVDSLPEPKQLLIAPEADHFWFNGMEQAATAVADFFVETL